MKKNAPAADPELLLGFDTSDDAAVYRIVRNTGVQADDVLFYTKKIGSGLAARLFWDDLPLFNGVYQYSVDGCCPGRSFNLVEWGKAFVKQDGLVHISKMAERFVRHPSEVVSVGDNVTVWVTGIDKTRGKISLSMVEGK